MSPTSERIDELEALKPEHDFVPPSPDALARLRSFDHALSYVPAGDGGVQVEFHALGLDFEVFIDSKGIVSDWSIGGAFPEAGK